MTVRVLLVDDSELVREGLRMTLDPAPGIEVVGEAGDGAEGVAEADRLRPDVVLMDVRMPQLDGIEATRRIVALGGAPVRVLMLTTSTSASTCSRRSMPAWSGFTLKDTPPDDLLAGVLAVARDDALSIPTASSRCWPASPATARAPRRHRSRPSSTCSATGSRTPRSRSDWGRAPPLSRTRSLSCSATSGSATDYMLS